MRTVYSSALGVPVSALGFGCASLGSRISARQGRRALDIAFERGVTWYDVAPPYGDGEAEEVLGRFIQGRRSKVVVCTKFGIGRPNISPMRRVIRPIARRLVEIIPQIRAVISRARPTGVRAPIDPEAIEPSVVESLRRLRTDYIDVLAMHEPTAAEAVDGRIFDILERLRDRGFIRTISIAGLPTSIEAAIHASRPIAFGQFSDSLFNDEASRLRASIAPGVRPFFVTHTIFGSSAIKRLESMPKLKTAALDAIVWKQSCDPHVSASNILLMFAFSNNPDGVVITSMFSNEHLSQNCAISEKPVLAEFSEYLRRMIKSDETERG